MIRVAIYARVSTEEQAEHGYSIAAQLDTLRDYCKRNNKVVADEYVDRGVSGKSIEGRFELKRLLQDAAKNDFDEVIVWKISRLARKNIDLLKIVETLTRYNISFRSFSENFETETTMGKFALQMMGAVGELERNTIVDNVKMGMKQRARMGKWNGGLALGYKSILVDTDKRSRETSLIIDNNEALLVKKIFGLYASGKGLRTIANQLNREGCKTKKGNPFSTGAIKGIITNPLYVGKIRYNLYENWNERRRKGKNLEPILVDGEHEAIILEDLWNKVQTLQRKKAKASPRQFDGQYTLTGLLRCPKCTAAMVANRTKNTLKDGTQVIRRYYSCSNFRNKGSAVCSANSVSADYAEHYVYKRIKKVVSNPSVIRNLVKNINKRRKGNITPLRGELITIIKSIEGIEVKKKKYFELYEEERIEKELFVNRLDNFTSENENLIARKAEIETELNTDSIGIISFEYIQFVLTKIDQLLDMVSFEQKKSLLHLLIKEISINDNREIEKIEILIDYETQLHFLGTAPSDIGSEGAFSKEKPFKISFNI